MTTKTELTIGAETMITLGPGAGIHEARRDLPARPPPAQPLDVETLPEVVVWRGEQQPERPAFYFIDHEERLTSLTCGELLAGASRVASALRMQGTRRGDRVLVCFDTRPELLWSFFGCGLVGAVPVPIYPPPGASAVGEWKETTSRVMRRCGTRGALVEELLRVHAASLTERVDGGFAISPGQFAAPPEPLPAPSCGADDLAFIQFTSGTTSSPRGVMVPHRALLANARHIAATTRWHESDHVVIWLPLYHDMGLVGGVLSPLLHGIPVTLMSPLLFLLRPRRWLWAIHHFRGTLSPAPNFAYSLCVSKVRQQEIEGLDLSSWRVAYNGAELVCPETVQRFAQRYAPHGFAPTTMYPVYGMAETVLAATFPALGREPIFDRISRAALLTTGNAVPASADETDTMTLVATGAAFPGHEIAILDRDGKTASERAQGEIALRGPSLSAGYIDEPEATAAAFRGGWFHTGDLGYVANGQLFVCGRVKDLIIKGGRNYHPYDIELAAARTPGVRTGNVAAFGSTNQETGTEDLMILVESKIAPAERSHLERQVELAVTRRIGIRPDRVVVLPPQTLPKTSSGKIQRSKAKAMFLAGTLTPGRRRGRGLPSTLVAYARSYATVVLLRIGRLLKKALGPR